MKKIFKVIKYILKDESNKGERIRRVFAGIGWQLWKRIIKKPIIIKLDNGANYICFPDTVMGSFPIYSKIYESRNILFVRSFLKNKGIMLDIGANVGIYSVLLKDKISKTILFEPVPETVKKLNMNMCINNIDYKIYDIALGDRKGEIYIDFKKGQDTTAKISNNKKGIKVKMEKLDNILTDEILNQLEYVKIDVEGYEYNVLKGAIKLLSSSSVRLIQFERLKTTDPEPIFDILKSYGWTVFTIDKNGNPIYDNTKILESHDLFATKGK